MKDSIVQIVNNKIEMQNRNGLRKVHGWQACKEKTRGKGNLAQEGHLHAVVPARKGGAYSERQRLRESAMPVSTYNFEVRNKVELYPL